MQSVKSIFIDVTAAPGLVAPSHFTPSLSPLPLLLPTTSSDFVAVPSLPAFPILQHQSSILAQFCGDYVAFADSKSPRKYTNSTMASAPIKRIVYFDGAYQVLFSDLPGHSQSYQIRIAADGARVQLFSPSNPHYSFTLLPPMNHVASDCLSWGNDFDSTHVVSWQKVPTRASMKYEDFFRGVSVTPKQWNASPGLFSIDRSSRASSASSTCPLEQFEDVLPLGTNSSPLPVVTPQHKPVFVFPQVDSLSLPPFEAERSRPPSPCLSPQVSPAGSRRNSFSSSTFDIPNDFPEFDSRRDSKQSLVNRVEPEVDALIGHKYATKEEWRVNQSGRHGPPVLRGEDVLFIPAKKQAALENVEELIKLVLKTCTIKSASKVCQKKKKRQKKGFLVYLQLASAAEVQNFLSVYYPKFQDCVAGVKTAIFEKDKKAMVRTASMI